MKEQILLLDPHDDYPSARDKIGWVQTDRVLLVWPPQGLPRRFNRPLDLLLLQRHAASLGAKIALVTGDPVVCDHAEALGIPVFDSIDDSHLRPWRSRRIVSPARLPGKGMPAFADSDDAPTVQFAVTLPRWKWTQHPAVRWFARATVFVAAIVVVAAMLALTVPGAAITLTPQGQHLNADIRLTADPAQLTPDAQRALIPAKIVTVTVLATGQAATTGSEDEATQRAGGTITFTNLTGQPVRIPAGAAVRTTGGTAIRFITQKDATLEARRGATADAPILAMEPGPTGNVGAGLINSLEGPLAVQAAAINVNPTAGGEVKQVPSVTAADRTRLEQILLGQLRQQGYAQLSGQLKEGEFMPPASAATVAVLSETFDHFAGEKADTLTLEMRAEVGATVVNERDAFAVGRAQLESQLGNALVILPETVAFSRETLTTVDSEGRVLFNINTRADATAAIDTDALRAAARWQPAEGIVESLYEQFPVVVRPDVSVWPPWFPRLPWLAWRIDVTIKPGSG